MTPVLFATTEAEADRLRADTELLKSLRTFVFDKSSELGLKLNSPEDVTFEISSKEHVDEKYQGDYWRYFR